MLAVKKYSFLFICLIAAVPVFAAPGDGIQIGDLSLNPFVEGSYIFDSNVHLDPTNEVDDAYVEAIGGLQFHYNRRRCVVEGRLFAQFRRYQELSGKDFDDWGEKLMFRTGSRDTLYIMIDQTSRQVTDYDRSTYFGGTLRPEAQNLSLTYDRSTRVERNLHDVGLVIGRNFSDRLELDIGVAAAWQDYTTNVLFDVDYISAKGEVGWRMTDKMSLVLSGEVMEEQNQSFDGSARSTTVHLGVKRKTTDKLSFRVGAGMSSVSRPSDINEYGREVQALSGWERGINEGPRSDEEAFSFDIAGTWVATDKITLEIAGHNAIQSAPQYPNTLDYISVGSMSVVYDFSDRKSTRLNSSHT